MFKEHATLAAAEILRGTFGWERAKRQTQTHKLEDVRGRVREILKWYFLGLWKQPKVQTLFVQFNCCLADIDFNAIVDMVAKDA